MRQRGFSMIELMVTLVILVLLVLAAMPSIGVWLDNTRIRNEGDSILTGLQTARAEAIKRNQNVSFWLVQLTDPATLANDCALSDSAGSWMVSTLSPASHCADPQTWNTDNTPTSNNSAGIILGRPMGGDSTHVSVQALQSNGTATTYITFNSFGRVADTASISRINICAVAGGCTATATRNLSVLISMTGSARLCDPLVSVKTDPRYCPATP